MSAVVTCDFCPNLFLPGITSPGVSRESDTLFDKGTEILKSELDRTQENKYSRLQDARNLLDTLFKEHSDDDWDGRDALAIPYRAIEEAKSLITQIPEKYPMPEIIPETTGEVGFEWYVDSYRVLVLSVAGDGFVYYAGLFGFKNTDHGSKPLVGQLNKKIISLLEEIYK